MLVVFDVDGTLLDSQHAIVASMAEAYQLNGLEPPSREQVLAVVGLSVREAVEAISLDRPDHPIDAIGLAFKQSFNARRKAAPEAVPLYDGALDILKSLAARDGVLLGIATGNSRRGVDRFLDTFGVRDLFAATQCADDAPSKPHPAMLLQAAAEAGVPAEDMVMIGDTTFDMMMARSAGARAIGVAWGYHPADRLLASGAERVIASFDELDSALGFGPRQVRAPEAAE